MTTMEYTHLGETGLEVSRLCLGCANFGSGTSHGDHDRWAWTNDDVEQSLAVLDRAIEAGINYIDTANYYSQGESEEVVGRAIEGRRDDLVVATKVGSPMGAGPNASGLSRKHVLEQAERSLERLGTDYIDLYQIHMWDEDTPIEETLSALDHLVNEGAVRYVGASNAASWQLMKALYESDRHGYQRFVSMQPEYNLVSRDAEAETLPACRDQGLGVVTYSPVAAGFFAGVYDRDDPPEPGSRLEAHWERLDEPAKWETYDRVVELADEKDATPVQVATAWVLGAPGVTAPIVGPEDVAQLEEYLGALDVELSAEDRAYLEAPVDEA
jgi:aryl-alcohol dehydrogenase-like predicted oxidoreductase